MKKIFFSAVMALVLGCFIGCAPRVSICNEPKLDEANSTVEGKYYDNTVYKCWKFTWEYTEKTTGEADVHENGVDYEWTTELMAQYELAMWMYSHNVSASAYGVSSSVSGTCKLEVTPDNESTCYDRD